MDFSDDQVIIAEGKDDICFMLLKLDKGHQKWGLTVNTNKTEYVVVRNTCRDIGYC